jgi:medium-chain acyl-[acyl-carrier-protein] hydrolase
MSWFSVPRPGPPARARLFCIPYAGSGASCYHAWSRALAGESIEVRSVQLPGRENRLREAPFFSMSPLIAALADHVEPLLDRPYGFFGHSMGALVAFELARELRRRGHAGPAFLCASGATAPQVPREDEPLHGLPDDELVRQVAERYQGIPQQVLENQELLELVVPALRADLSIIETYEFSDGACLPCGISAFAGQDDRHVTPEKLAPWGELTGGLFTSRQFAGDHFFLHDHRDELIDAILLEFRRMGLLIHPGVR